MSSWIAFFVKNYLHYAFTVAQINKCERAKIAPSKYPSHQSNFLASVLGA
jgi:hypothetical protein